ncbi:MAG: hypothetical protein A2Z14_18050 [Chloroflexi bacterium RBG_16_48_8]|nr:MAG: hypothetical protein A2Z14_18050 [Chloroflexi bacterium RBG_16_48_8]
MTPPAGASYVLNEENLPGSKKLPGRFYPINVIPTEVEGSRMNRKRHLASRQEDILSLYRSAHYFSSMILREVK